MAFPGLLETSRCRPLYQYFTIYVNGYGSKIYASELTFGKGTGVYEGWLIFGM